MWTKMCVDTWILTDWMVWCYFLLLNVCTWCVRLFVVESNVCWCVQGCMLPSAHCVFMQKALHCICCFVSFCLYHYHEWEHHLGLWLNKHQYILNPGNLQVLFISSTMELDFQFVKTRSSNIGVVWYLF